MPSVMLQYCCTLQSFRTSLLTDTHHFVHTAVQRVCLFVCLLHSFTARLNVVLSQNTGEGRDSNE